MSELLPEAESPQLTLFELYEDLVRIGQLTVAEADVYYLEDIAQLSE